jgi:hypothetical protein
MRLEGSNWYAWTFGEREWMFYSKDFFARQASIYPDIFADRYVVEFSGEDHEGFPVVKCREVQIERGKAIELATAWVSQAS